MSTGTLLTKKSRMVTAITKTATYFTKPERQLHLIVFHASIGQLLPTKIDSNLQIEDLILTPNCLVIVARKVGQSQPPIHFETVSKPDRDKLVEWFLMMAKMIAANKNLAFGMIASTIGIRATVNELLPESVRPKPRKRPIPKKITRTST